jgi:hypothetical protein
MSSQEGIRVIPSVGTCFPASCSNRDVQKVLNNTMQAYLSNVIPIVHYCATDTKPDFDVADISVMYDLELI